jgi:lipopolysaccharide transport system ATP-binding protein
LNDFKERIRVSLVSADIAIQARGLSKCYPIFDKPQDRLKQMLSLGRGKYYREFWALKDVSLMIKKGGSVGIIGRNGAGKSTLLQVICGVLAPTAGSVEVNGRVAALLELGSGFNPEFTGRENVFMNAAVLGLSSEEIAHRYEDIVAFADIGDFVNQPVKIYSSGMLVRLAFSVMAHVDADILVIDEALAVGDFVFVQKCMRFLRNFMEQGTLIFVSHRTDSVVNLCQEAIWLEQGKMRRCGSPKEICEDYLRDSLQSVYGADVNLEQLDTATNGEIDESPVVQEVPDLTTSIRFFDGIESTTGWKTGHAEIISARFLDARGQPLTVAAGGETVCLELKAKAQSELYSPILGFFVKDKLGQPLFGENTYTYVDPPMTLAPGQVCVAKFYFSLPLLPNGQYSITVAIASGTPINNIQHHRLHDAVLLSVLSQKLRYGLVGIPFRNVSMTLEEKPCHL